MTAVDLDALDAAHEEWRTDGIDVDTTDGKVWNALFRRPRWMDADDVHRLVAEHNALPALIADARKLRALREAMEALADTLDRQAKDMESVRADAVAAKPADPVTLYADSVARNVAKAWTKIARRIRAVLAAALTSEGERE